MFYSLCGKYHWLLPHPGALNINVYGATPFIPFLNGNTCGIGMIIRNSEGGLVKLSTGILPANSELEYKLNAIHIGLIKVLMATSKR